MSDTPSLPTQAQLEASLQTFEAEARAVPKSAWQQPKLGMGDFIKETRTTLSYAEQVWDTGPQGGAPPLKVARSKYAQADLARLGGLLNALQYVHAQELASANPGAEIGPKVARAEFLMSELDSVLSFALDDDLDEPADDKLNALQSTTKDASSGGATVGQLVLAWGLFAQDERVRLAALEDFDPALIDEAISLGTTLTAATPKTPTERADLRDLRLGLYTLAHANLQSLRKAANYAYRHHPDIKQKFSSALERNRRAQARLQKKLAEVTATPAPTP